MKSDILASKGVLVSDPNVKKMNKAQWIFEYEGYIRKRKKFLRDIALVLVGEKAQKLDIEKELELLPLAYVLNPEVMNEYIKDVDLDIDEKEYMNDEEYEAMLKRYEESGCKLDDIDLMEEEKEEQEKK